MKWLCTLVLILTLSLFYTQQTCGTDEMHQRLYMDFPGIHQKVIQNHNKLEQFTDDYIGNQLNQKKTITYIIPAVFHVIHNYGPENITDQQIYDQMRIINEDYQKRNGDTINLISAFDTLAADCEIEFRIAQLDPIGGCTSGITRYHDVRTYIGDHSVKDIVQWPPDKYLNIYICADAAGLAGHALVPSAADTISQWDGIVLKHNSVGSIGTSNPTRSVVCTHEIGHYLNLQHTWGGNNVPNYPYLPCADAGNCAYDDGVADTPNTIGWQSCNLNGTSCSSLDNVQNFMEYAYCPAMFTEGQKLRMHACLNSTIANRNNLWQPANLISTGTDGTNYFCDVNFTNDKEKICQGESIQFFDASYHGITSHSWEFDGGNPSVSSDTNPNITYNTPGIYKVKLTAGNGITFDSLIIDSLIEIFPSIAQKTFIIEDWEWTTDINDSYWFTNNPDGQVGWEIANIGFSSTRSVSIGNINNFQQQIDELITRPIDLTGVSDLELSFKYAFAIRQSNNSDKLKVLVSTDCGNSWVIRKILYSSQLNTFNDTISTSFIPSSDLEWDSITVTTITSAYWTADFMLKFQFESGGGNNIYLDKINLMDPATAGTEVLDQNTISVYPNPTNDFITLDISGYNGSIQTQVYDLSGRLLKISNSTTISIKHYAKGVYIFKVAYGDRVEAVRVLRQ